MANKLNRQRNVAGYRYSKTVTLSISEQLSEAGVPIFLSDIKGDLASLAEKAK